MSSNSLKLGQIIAIASVWAFCSCGSAKKIEVSAETQKVLALVLKAKDDATKVGANIGIKEFKNASEDLNDVIIDVNEGDIKGTEKERAELEKEFRNIELKLIKDKNLAGVKSKLKMVIEKDGDEKAPKSIVAAKASIIEAEKTIDVNRYDDAGIAKKVEEATFLVDRASAIVAQVDTLDNKTAEDIILGEEHVINTIRSASDGVILDNRNKPITDQATDVAMFVKTSIKVGKSINDQKKELEGEVVKKESELQVKDGELQAKENVIQAKESEMQALARQEEAVNKIRSIFTAGEADVFVQDGKIVVRLVGLGFKVGSSSLEDSNKELLSKMQSVVTAIQANAISVEGHTDSMGPVEINDKLSMARAEAIKVYLVQNNIITEDKIKSEGYGANRPIATNDDWQGRKKNRRIDIVMEI